MSSLAPRPTSLTFTSGEPGDLDDVLAIMETAFPADFGEAWTRSQCAGILPMSGVVLTVAREERSYRPLGFSLLRTVADEAELLLIAVVPDARRRGIGKALLTHFIDHCRGLGARRLHLEVRDGNPAVMLYRSVGFEIAGRRSNYYRGRTGDQFDALTLVHNNQADCSP